MFTWGINRFSFGCLSVNKDQTRSTTHTHIHIHPTMLVYDVTTETYNLTSLAAVGFWVNFLLSNKGPQAPPLLLHLPPHVSYLEVTHRVETNIVPQCTRVDGSAKVRVCVELEIYSHTGCHNLRVVGCCVLNQIVVVCLMVCWFVEDPLTILQEFTCFIYLFSRCGYRALKYTYTHTNAL